MAEDGAMPQQSQAEKFARDVQEQMRGGFGFYFALQTLVPTYPDVSVQFGAFWFPDGSAAIANRQPDNTYEFILSAAHVPRE